ncbi:hypothetical protein [Lyticum sinuosum]|uniref:Uncharacterized protein n=1 Tax=Lyticum sinuosum TaxID=1332059 RepID=A0AAE4VLV1_9RICK|nr:hypothetical protein [Lyticum sinuosum]MDZ5760884.1 hypothetical protein [Lyticum sinuosum]
MLYSINYIKIITILIILTLNVILSFIWYKSYSIVIKRFREEDISVIDSMNCFNKNNLDSNNLSVDFFKQFTENNNTDDQDIVDIKTNNNNSEHNNVKHKSIKNNYNINNDKENNLDEENQEVFPLRIEENMSKDDNIKSKENNKNDFFLKKKSIFSID